jgi:hypothetical protein
MERKWKNEANVKKSMPGPISHENVKLVRRPFWVRAALIQLVTALPSF